MIRRLIAAALLWNIAALAMTIARTSDAHANPKGAASFPHAPVTTDQLLEMRPTGRIVGSVMGADAGLGAAVAIALGPPAGFFIERSLDRKVTSIKVTR
jgi:hypothetical protein